MRKKLLVVGLVMLVVGVGVFFISTYEAGGLTHVSTTMNATSSGEWVSAPLNSTSTSSIVVVVTSGGTYGVIPVSDLASVGPTNLSTYALAASASVSASHTSVYNGHSGEYYLVVFSSSQPTVRYTVIGSLSQVAIFGVMVLAGGAIAFIGFILAIVGAVLKPKAQKQQM